MCQCRLRSAKQGHRSRGYTEHCLACRRQQADEMRPNMPWFRVPPATAFAVMVVAGGTSWATPARAAKCCSLCRLLLVVYRQVLWRTCDAGSIKAFVGGGARQRGGRPVVRESWHPRCRETAEKWAGNERGMTGGRCRAASLAWLLHPTTLDDTTSRVGATTCRPCCHSQDTEMKFVGCQPGLQPAQPDWGLQVLKCGT